MSNQERLLVDNWDGRAAYWQYRHNPAERQIKQPLQQTDRNKDDTWIILLGILVTIGFLVVLAKTTF